MKYLKNRTNLIIENLIKSDKASEMILEKGTEIFHGSGEDFDPKELRTGGYDGVLWSTLDSGISQTYIPVSGSWAYVSTRGFTKLPQRIRDNPKTYTNIFGLTWTDIGYDQYNQVSSFFPPVEFKETDDIYFELSKINMGNRENLQTIKDEISEFLQKSENKDIDRDKLEELITKETDLETKYAESTEKMRSNNKERARNEYINKLIRSKGYEPDTGDDHMAEYSWKLNTKYVNGVDTILDANYRESGRLFIMKPKRDFKILDLRKAEEGDLTDVDYHNIEGFRKAGELGYDGVYINDFAQTEAYGNFGHRSIGIIKNSIKDLDMEVVENVEHPNDDEMQRMSDAGIWASKEYLEYKKGL